MNVFASNKSPSLLIITFWELAYTEHINLDLLFGDFGFRQYSNRIHKSCKFIANEKHALNQMQAILMDVGLPRNCEYGNFMSLILIFELVTYSNSSLFI